MKKDESEPKPDMIKEDDKVEYKTKFDTHTKTFSEEEECPICFDLLLNQDVKSCPECHNFIHTACIIKWLSYNTSCVLCRSSQWSTFFKDSNQLKK